MTEFRISGVWKDANNVITHYGFHTVLKDNKVTRVKKMSKVEAITLLSGADNKAVTWVWDYSLSHWRIGEPVHVVNGTNGKFLRSNHDNQSVDNLSHLINYDWILS